MNVTAALIIALFAAQCPHPNWVIDDDRIHGTVTQEGEPVKYAEVDLSSLTKKYVTTTDQEGAFLIQGVADGKYSFAVKGWGKANVEVRGWHRGSMNRPLLLFSSTNGCLLLIAVPN